jgi:fucose 4-O-acetylase-like acetyltransferase
MSAPPTVIVETAPPPQPPAVAESSPSPASSPAQSRPPAKSRLLYIDNLRIVLISMVVLLHLAITYGATGDWWYNEAVPESMLSGLALTFYTTFAQAFTLAFFMMISSYFCPPAYDRKGPRAYTKDKLKRLGIPFLFYFAVLNPILVMIVNVFEGQPAIPPGVSPLAFWVDSVGPGLMWFVEALLLFSLVYALWRLATSRRGRPAPSSASQTQRVAPGNGKLALFALGVGLVSFVVRLVFPVGYWLEPFHFQLAQFPQYIAYFVVGLVAYRRGWFAGIRVSQAKLWVWVVVALLLSYPVIVVLGGVLEGGVEPFLGGLTWQSLLYSLWEQFLCVGVVVALGVWFRERFNHQGRLAANLGADSYAVYIFHPLVIVPLAFVLSGITMMGLLKWLWVAPLALALCFLFAHVVRKLPLARDIL